ncbi:DUF2169 domain-containing protein [Agrobacterium rubi]|uniref:DUF2169 domain-containing protein n=1 Tax=Agrobacterium rubi TR3 = NBRC 13261 TaxID=1368415 RepID=A0A081D132_9HYPH|nr:DUF2169 domain-containing protein [Agrobacterium rubi]MBP1880457.1 hypothetical protein [Agrobacterium rubi]NTF10832.1 DUF2169 domain-containing protein [Agrobacterium rubi]NTF23248.1 DUF2169 domain-containing protein [Agrobacterium rubi]NTF30168.1 DUF2169 domain-containing protein [Agrobacterium rubi]GAK72628.1 hypothetical protein RRU01S_27_00160 [Agrobacterium rubi TR3 = NBRC 13261]
MWEVDNRSPFAALGYFVRDHAGLEHWVLSIRARFSILQDGFSRLSDDQGEIRIRPDYAADLPEEMLSEADFFPFRPKTDFILTGDVVAPEGRSVNKVEFGFELGSHSKSAVAFGSRLLRVRNGALRLEGYEPFQRCRLSWRNSLGGSDFAEMETRVHPANPIGFGWTAKWGQLTADTDVKLPLIESMQAPIGAGTLPDPCGFGVVQPGWAGRARYAGTYDEDWRKYEAPLLPADFSPQFFQAAPEGQVIDIKGGEPIRVVGLHETGDYRFRLPQLVFDTATWIGRQKIEARPRLISVTVNGTEKTIEMLWNAAIACPEGDMAVARSRVQIKQMAGVVS